MPRESAAALKSDRCSRCLSALTPPLQFCECLRDHIVFGELIDADADLRLFGECMLVGQKGVTLISAYV